MNDTNLSATMLMSVDMRAANVQVKGGVGHHHNSQMMVEGGNCIVAFDQGFDGETSMCRQLETRLWTDKCLQVKNISVVRKRQDLE